MSSSKNEGALIVEGDRYCREVWKIKQEAGQLGFESLTIQPSLLEANKWLDEETIKPKVALIEVRRDVAKAKQLGERLAESGALVQFMTVLPIDSEERNSSARKLGGKIWDKARLMESKGWGEFKKGNREVEFSGDGERRG